MNGIRDEAVMLAATSLAIREKGEELFLCLSQKVKNWKNLIKHVK